jgi:hypothetical protein
VRSGDIGLRPALTRDASGYLTDRYSERKDEAAKVKTRLNLVERTH